MKRKFLIAEYCPGPFFWGWWLYLRDRNDGSPNDCCDWGWIRYEFAEQAVYRLLYSMGPYNPPWGGRTRLGEWFAAAFPGGIEIETDDRERDLTLIGVVTKLPQQRKRAIRTLKKAKRYEP